MSLPSFLQQDQSHPAGSGTSSLQIPSQNAQEPELQKRRSASLSWVCPALAEIRGGWGRMRREQRCGSDGDRALWLCGRDPPVDVAVMVARICGRDPPEDPEPRSSAHTASLC